MTRDEWTRDVLAPARARAPERLPTFRTSSGRQIDVTYTPDDVASVDYARALGDPGTFPFTRGTRAEGCAGAAWAIGRIADDAALFDRAPDAGAPVTLTDAAPAPVVFAQYLALAESHGVPWAALAGTIDSDPLTELLASRTCFCAVPRAARLAVDAIVFATAHVPGWTPISVSGPRLRDAGATPQQELALALAAGVEYVALATGAGLDIETVASRVLITFEIGDDLFEEVAKLRAARRVWAHVMRDRFEARADACALRTHAQTGARSLNTTQPCDNVARTTLHALAAMLGGAESVRAQPFDVATSSPTIEAATLALRTPQILAHESGLAAMADAFGGSWWLERLTDDMAAQAIADLDRIARQGGLIAAIDAGSCALPRVHVQADAAVGALAASGGPKRRRDAIAVWGALDALASAVNGSGSSTDALVACTRAAVTVREMCDVLRNA